MFIIVLLIKNLSSSDFILKFKGPVIKYLLPGAEDIGRGYKKCKLYAIATLKK